MWYVYIIESLVYGTLYKGVASDYGRRLAEHNSGKSTYTSRKISWTLVYVEANENKTEALKRELMFKRQNRKYFEWLFVQGSNILRES